MRKFGLKVSMVSMVTWFLGIDGHSVTKVTCSNIIRFWWSLGLNGYLISWYRRSLGHKRHFLEYHLISMVSWSQKSPGLPKLISSLKGNMTLVDSLYCRFVFLHYIAKHKIRLFISKSPISLSPQFVFKLSSL